MKKVLKANYPKLNQLEALMTYYGITRAMLAKYIGRSYGVVCRYISGITDIPLNDVRLITQYLSEVSQKPLTIFDVFEKEPA
jgi:predicted transcriptional regulator